jgi:hypothetical protein
MTLATNYPPIPGTWVRRAQDAVDAVSTMTTLDEVTAYFGTARALAEAVLGSTGRRRSCHPPGSPSHRCPAHPSPGAGSGRGSVVMGRIDR